MDASIKGENLKTFLRLLQCASKYGDDLNIHASHKAWELAVTNANKSAFCLFKLDKKFFYRWSAKSRKGVKCQLLVKSVLAVLGKAAQMNTILRLDLRIIDPSNELRPLQHRKRDRDTRSESVVNGDGDDHHDGNGNGAESDRHFGDEDEFTDDEDARISIESKLIVRLVCKHGVTKKHSLHLGSSDFLRADVDPDTTPSGFVIATRTLRDWLENFALSTGSTYAGNSNTSGTDQLGWMFTKNEVRMKLWEGLGAGGLCTEIKVDTDEFQDYEVVGDRIDLTLPMKEFRATLMLAERLSATLNVSFSEPGQPLTLTSLDEEFEDFSIFCAIATTACEAFKDIRSPSVEIKRSSSDAPAPPPPPSTYGRNLSSSSSSSGRKRKGSETPSQSRKRSSLNLTAAQEPMSTFYLASSAIQRNASAGPSNARHQDDDHMEVDHPDHISPSQNGDKEALFLPGASQNHGSPEQPLRSQAIKISQAEILEHAGLSDMNLEEELDMADLDDEREMEEEFARSQQNSELVRPSSARDYGSTSPLKGKGKDKELPPSSKGSNETITTKSNKSHPERVTDSISDNSTSNAGLELIWDSTIDNPSPGSPTKRGQKSMVSTLSPQKRQPSPQKGSTSPWKGYHTGSPSKSSGKGKNVNPDEEYDELTDEDEGVGHPTQERHGSSKFKSFFND
ncbi:hypothetical protein I302_108692 [Kwoniella bestiolae CBS 10118]|uniref:Cell cycle checkpoint control protein RAD9A n=1 Tax=Kwoniella bestiolae CBS 10118 TaxID=1296100 RepID=A0A1B9FTT6_9TREE|nr:hypothetical protein I302_07828 [Kwoniella bestiolae CBS 10118]OCF22184.1 hypothetical protein I302_07828 [Kwoniella bestiolae CBS 10118]